KQANGPVMISFFPDGDGGPQSHLCKAPTAVLFGEHTFRGQSQRIKFQTRGLCHSFKSADEAAGHSRDQKMFWSPPADLTLKFRRRAKRYGRQDSFGMNDAVASPCADSFNTIFVNGFHSVLLECDGGDQFELSPRHGSNASKETLGTL